MEGDYGKDGDCAMRAGAIGGPARADHRRGGDETGDKYRRGCDGNAAKASGPCGPGRSRRTTSTPRPRR